ncbi:hypothetical protein SAMN05216378_4521 [Paenibacillus catalpae]|uniref:Uncharacterized protein n=1 Tax=Paenibacillus catalpae TaxID=1045775 RepID=A0A1I2ETK7_9BACL|nr:hypothetical protein SAMN05216378_4521 [Paenibacillus catalpae]
MYHTSPETALKMKRWPKNTIAAGHRHSVGLLSDGTVMAVGRVDEILKIKGDLREMFIEFETSEQTMQS